MQDHAKAKLAYDFSPTLRASYTLGWWRNDAVRTSDTWLRDGADSPVYSGAINVDGRQYLLAATDFAPSRGDLQHFIHGLSLKQGSGGEWDWEVAASLYDYDRDEVRSPDGGVADWHRLRWRRSHHRSVGNGLEHAGIEGNVAARRTVRPISSTSVISATAISCEPWYRQLRTGSMASAGGRFSAFQGDTLLQSVYAQDTWHFAQDWRATLGLRAEDWQASDGALANAISTLTFPDRSETHLSPKAAIAWQVAPQWSLKASLGRAVRMPTVAELYQGSISTSVIVNNDPDLKPEKSWTGELTTQRELDRGSLRATVFHEDTRDALYSQTNVTVTPNVTNIQNVDRIRTTGV